MDEQLKNMEKIEVKSIQPKSNIKFIAIGSMGANAFYKIPENEKYPFLALDTDICGFFWVANAKKILCGKELCRGLGCGGRVGRGYAAAHETLFHQMGLFDNQETNIFILGLGGGTGTGILQYILSDLYRARGDKQIKNKYNIVICTFPLNLEIRRLKRASLALEESGDYAIDLLILIRLEELFCFANNLSIHELFRLVNEGVRKIINNILNLDYNLFLKLVQEYIKNNKVMEINTFNQFEHLFAGGINEANNNAPINRHFTGQGRDLEQLKAINKLFSSEKTFLFVGCSSGEELVDFQEIFQNSKAQFFGIDNNQEIVERANQVKYTFPTRIFVADVLKKEFLETMTKNTNNSQFDVVICRNLLIYYPDELVKEIIQRLAKLTRKILVLGISDPFPYTVENDLVKFGEISFKVIDFENRIFCRGRY
ncbi:MAG: methyltransferase domain-containing protein [Nanoarchaeota archaeon]